MVDVNTMTKHVENETAQQRQRHPSRNLEPRSRGYGIGGGYERPYRKATPVNRPGRYAPLPHSGYYGAGSSARRFDLGQAGFKDEISWYGPQYGETTSK